MGGFGWIAVISALVQYGFARDIGGVLSGSPALAPEMPLIKSKIEQKVSDALASAAPAQPSQFERPAPITPHDGKAMASVGGSAGLEVAKPTMNAQLSQHLFQFQKNVQTEQCMDIAEEMNMNEATARAHVHLMVVLGCLQDEMFKTAERLVTRDKSAESSLTLLATEMVSDGGDGSAGDLVNYMDRIIKCQVEPMAETKTILQKILELGLEKSLKTSFVENLLRGTNSYDPALMLDNVGNSLMHSAVLSGVWHMPTTLFNLENKKNIGDPSRKLNGAYWLISVLLHRNDAGKRPLDMCTTANMADKLKRVFRVYTFYFEMRAIQFGLEDVMREVNSLLKSSGTTPFASSSPTPYAAAAQKFASQNFAAGAA